MPAPTPTHITRHIRQYLHALAASDTESVIALFASDARIYSPLLGWVTPMPFYRQLAAVSGNSQITLQDICLSVLDQPRATACFTYDWRWKDDSLHTFECVDIFDFNPQGLIEKMVIVYDTHPIRDGLGDRFRLDNTPDGSS